MGKAQAPPSGQTLPFYKLNIGGRSDPRHSLGVILAVIGIALQILLRKIRIVVMSILICGRW